MTYVPATHHRRSIRLRGYDNAAVGAYFITICTQDRRCLLGEIRDAEIELNGFGRIVMETWEWLEVWYQYIELDEYVVMPNHIHGILICRGGSRTAPTDVMAQTAFDMGGGGNPGAFASPEPPPKPIGRLVGAFKTVSAERINESFRRWLPDIVFGLMYEQSVAGGLTSQ